MASAQITALCFYFRDSGLTTDHLNQTLASLNQEEFSQVILFTDAEKNMIEKLPEWRQNHSLRPAFPGQNLGILLNQAFKTPSAFFVLIDNRTDFVLLKNGFAAVTRLMIKYHPEFSLLYADYELENNGAVIEKHLLKHHAGRLRDNQDFGKVWVLSAAALDKAGYADEKIRFNTLYDLRLKMAEHGQPEHISNRYAGSLYRVRAEGKTHNVFDYLLAGKESQLEAEQVLTAHLQRISAWLEPGHHYSVRPQSNNSGLKASFIIPVNNRPEFITSAIESIQNQTIRETEVIVVCNGGEADPTIPAVQAFMSGGHRFDPAKPEVRLLTYAVNNLGLCLNMGAEAARGEFYVQLDSDDLVTADAVEKILAVYESDPKIGMVIGSYEVWEKKTDGSLERMKNLPVVTHDEWTEENGRNNLLRINGAGAPRSIPIELIRQMGFSMNEEPFARNYGEDYSMVLRISEKHRIGRVWEAIYKVVRHSGGTDHSIDQVTIDRNDEAKDYMRLEAIKRRRKINGKQDS